MAEWISMAEKKGSFGAGQGISVDQLTMRIASVGKNKKSLKIRLGLDAMKASKLKMEDSIDFLIDPEAKKGLIKKNGQGWKIKPSGKRAGGISINWTIEPPFTFEGTKIIEYKVGKDGLVFDLPSAS